MRHDILDPGHKIKKQFLEDMKLSLDFPILYSGHWLGKENRNDRNID